MSAGKTTVINSLIGFELLHSANEATTATITRIHDQDNLPVFSGKAYSYNNKILDKSNQVTAELIKKWNANSEIKMIDLVGNIKAIHNDTMDIVIYDTPGPNNSQNDNHQKLTLEVINDGNYGLILYVINATQLGVQDDRDLLEDICRALNKDKSIIFLLNKAEQLDAEKGENLSDIVNTVEKYLTQIGFQNPIIIPTSASQALVCQKALNRDKLTRYQITNVKSALELNNTFILESKVPRCFKKQALIEVRKEIKPATRINITDKLSVKQNKLIKSYLRSGLGLVSLILQNKLMNKNH